MSVNWNIPIELCVKHAEKTSSCKLQLIANLDKRRESCTYVSCSSCVCTILVILVRVLSAKSVHLKCIVLSCAVEANCEASLAASLAFVCAYRYHA